MTETRIPASQSNIDDPAPTHWPSYPVETEIYILPDGQVIVADLPRQLAECIESIGQLDAGGANHER